MTPINRRRRRRLPRILGGAAALLVLAATIIGTWGGQTAVWPIRAGVTIRLDLQASRDMGALPSRDGWCSGADHCYPLQTSDATMADSSGSRHLTRNGAPREQVATGLAVISAGVVETTSEVSVWADGVAGRYYSTAASQDATNLLSITAVVYTQQGSNATLASHRADVGSKGWGVYSVGDGKIRGFLDGATTFKEVVSNATYGSEWHCITVVLDGRTANAGAIYSDGADNTLSNDLSGAGSIASATAMATIAANATGTTRWLGGIARLRIDYEATTLAQHQTYCGDLWQAPAGGPAADKPLSADATWTQTGGAVCYPTSSTTAVCQPGGVPHYTVDATGLGWAVEPDAVNRVLYSTAIDCTTWTCRASASGTTGQVAPDGSATATLITVAGGANHFEQNIASGYTADASPLHLRMWIKCSSGIIHPHGSDDDTRGDWDLDCSVIGGLWTLVDRNHASVTVNIPFNADGSGASGLHFDGKQTPISATVWAPTLTEEPGTDLAVIPTAASAVSTGDPVWAIANELRNTGSQLLADSDMEAGPGPELIVNGDLEDATYVPFIAGNDATLAASAADPHGGSYALRATYNGTANPYAVQVIATAGVSYALAGWGRGDSGDGNATVYDGGIVSLWIGTTDATWQAISKNYVAAHTGIYFLNSIAGAGWAEWDDLSLKATAPDWIAENSALITKSTASPHGGSYSLREAYTDTPNPYARQIILTAGEVYRVTGWARGDDSGTAPRLYIGTMTPDWLGTDSGSWQAFDVTAVSDNNSIGFLANAGTGWVEWDDVTVYEQESYGTYYRTGDTVTESSTIFDGTCWDPLTSTGDLLLSGLEGTQCAGIWYALDVRR